MGYGYKEKEATEAPLPSAAQRIYSPTFHIIKVQYGVQGGTQLAQLGVQQLPEAGHEVKGYSSLHHTLVPSILKVSTSFPAFVDLVLFSLHVTETHQQG